ncbi:carbohydrate binding domain-containing protein [Paenibacillus hexagrammi]|uniref:Carbohydrate binding domain-containing protein n=1 Tax=Paenibacillus hexagrammi TaxID=2908839 RepID=A0ABY3SJV0_9BACL|nr:carbohydrate binding domain-containing protein [Paenibacillus sp. YPD9-1]UJF34298.1 carbohydrate binding domain-containing protein [Paenibacillus sp. YPD9-1]
MVFNEKWTNPRGGVESVSSTENGTFIKMKQPAWYNLRNKGGTSVNSPWYIENAYELLDQDGEWYLNRVTDTLYYKPRQGEDMTTAVVTVPTVETLLSVKGSDVSNPVHNIQFVGLSFEYSTWLRPNSNYGHADVQSNILRELDLATLNMSETLTPAAVLIQTGKWIQFERCRFTHLGSASINVIKGSQDNLFQGNSFTDISGSGIQMGEMSNKDVSIYNPFDPRLVMRSNDVVNNYFYNLGVEYRSAVAIFASYPQDMHITHNEIANLPYSGITIGWGWGEYDTSNRGVRIENNYIHNVMLTLNDGGAIYTLGTSYDMQIRGNYLKDQEHDQSAIYFDQGSSWITAEDNVVENSPTNLYVNPANDIQVNRTYSDTYLKVNLGTRTYVTNTVYVSDGNWPEEAQAIMANAGLESAYKDIITEPQQLTAVSDHRPHPTPLPEPIPVIFTGKSGLVTGILKAGKVRNNYANWVGMKFTVGSSPMTVTALGRLHFPGSVEPHQLRIVDAATNLEVPGTLVTIQMSKAPLLGDFKYVQLPAPVQLQANKTYYLMSMEANGGDVWYDGDLVVSNGSAATINKGVWGTSYKEDYVTGNSFVGLNILYEGSPSDSPAAVMIPPVDNGPSEPDPIELPVDLENTSGVFNTAMSSVPRNNWGGWLGYKFTVGSQPLFVSSIGRKVVQGNIGKHQLMIVEADTEAIVAQAKVTLAGATPGQMKYVQLDKSVRLQPGKSYYVLSLEVYGGDKWYEAASIQPLGSVASVDYGIYKSNDLTLRPQSYISGSQPGSGFVGLDLRYELENYGAENLIKNGQFEYDTKNWSVYNANLTKDTGITYNNSDGAGKLFMFGSFGMAYQNVMLEKNKLYEVSVWVKLETGSSTAQIILDHTVGTPRYDYLAANTPVDTTWRQVKARYKYTGTNPDGSGAIQIRIGNGQTRTTYYFDDFTIREIPEQVFNGDFEANTSGWTPYNATLTRVTSQTNNNSAGSAKVTMTGTFGMASQKLVLEKNVRYQVSAMVRLESGTGDAQMILDHITGTPRYDYLATTPVSTTWTQLKSSFVYTGPNDTANADMWIRIGDGKTKLIFYLDDISVQREVIDHINVSVDKTSFAVGETGTFTVTGQLGDGSAADLSQTELRFLSSDSSVIEATYESSNFTYTGVNDNTNMLIITPPMDSIGNGGSTVTDSTYGTVTDSTYGSSNTSVVQNVYNNIPAPSIPPVIYTNNLETVTLSAYGPAFVESVNGRLTSKKEGMISFRVRGTYNGKLFTSEPIMLIVDGTSPTATISYSTTGPTNQNVVATITPSEPIVVTNNAGELGHTFTENGAFTFEFTDAAGNRGSATATVSNIDKTPPNLQLTVNKPVLSPPNRKMIPIKVKVTSSDNGSGSGISSIVLTSITSNEPDEEEAAIFIENALMEQLHLSTAAKEELEHRGISLYGPYGELRKSDDIMQDLQRVIINLDQEDRDKLMKSVFQALNGEVLEKWLSWFDRRSDKIGADIEGTDIGSYDTEFSLRAERLESGTGRIYTIIYTATDLAGNVKVASTQVTVPKK